MVGLGGEHRSQSQMSTKMLENDFQFQKEEEGECKMLYSGEEFGSASRLQVQTMKQETTTTPRSEHKTTSTSATTSSPGISTCSNNSRSPAAATPTRFRASVKATAAKEMVVVKTEDVQGRAKSVPPDMKNNSKAKRTLMMSKSRIGENGVGSQKGREVEESKIVGKAGIRQILEQSIRQRRLRPVLEPTSRASEDGTLNQKKRSKELQEKLMSNETLIKSLQSEVLALKAELEKAQNLNVELELKNQKLTEDLSAAETKIAALSSCSQGEKTGEYSSPKFKDIQKLIANKLEISKVRKVAFDEVTFKTTSPALPIRTRPKVSDSERAAPTSPPLPPGPPPPPPPLPPSRPRAKGSSTPKAPAVVEFYHFLTKKEGKKEQTNVRNSSKPAATSPHNSIVGEIQNRSAHLLAIKADIETRGEFINGLIQKVLAAAFTDIEDVLKFVDWLDAELSSLADERAVLKHFNWPERKADALREAAVEYRNLKSLESEISSYKDDPDIPCGTALKRMASLLDRSERGIQRLVKLRSSSMRSYKDCRIPIDWMLDSGMVNRIKKASMKLAKMYMERVTMEFESIRNSDREATQEALLLQGVHFAYRAHQFAGGLDSETLCAFEEIRQRVPKHLGGSQGLLAGIPSS